MSPSGRIGKAPNGLCPKCSSKRYWKEHKARKMYEPAAYLHCYDCHYRKLLNPSGFDIGKFSGSAELKRRVSYGLHRHYLTVSREKEQIRGKHISEGLTRHYANHHAKGKPGFICKIGDIEIYELRLGNRNRSPKDLPGRWSRTLHKRPKLTKAQRYRKWILRGDT